MEYDERLSSQYLLASRHAKGENMQYPIYKKWWFWLIVILLIGAIGSASGSSDNDSNTDTSNTEESKTDNSSSSKKEYLKVNIQDMLDELDENALRAETKYQNLYIEITGKISNIDSDGSYISVEDVNAGPWNFDTIMCFIKNKSQREFIMEKSVGDIVTIKGKVFSIGEVIGYSVNIDSISD